MPLPLLAVLGSSTVIAGIATLIRTAVVWALGSFVGTLILSLGIGTVSYLGLKPLIDNVMNMAFSYLSLPSDIQAYAGIVRLDQILTVWSSALAVKLALTSMKKFVLK